MTDLFLNMIQPNRIWISMRLIITHIFSTHSVFIVLITDVADCIRIDTLEPQNTATTRIPVVTSTSIASKRRAAKRDDSTNCSHDYSSRGMYRREDGYPFSAGCLG